MKIKVETVFAKSRVDFCTDVQKSIQILLLTSVLSDWKTDYLGALETSIIYSCVNKFEKYMLEYRELGI